MLKPQRLNRFGVIRGNNTDALYRHLIILSGSIFTDSNGRIKTGDKYAIQPRGSDVTYLAGLYRIEESRDLKYPVFSVLTKTPTDDLREIHDRMPLILPESAIDEWISPNGEPNKVVDKAVTELVIEKAV